MAEESIGYLDFEILKQKSLGFELYQEHEHLRHRLDEVSKKIEEILAFITKLEEKKIQEDQKNKLSPDIKPDIESEVEEPNKKSDERKTRSIGPKVEKNKK